MSALAANDCGPLFEATLNLDKQEESILGIKEIHEGISDTVKVRCLKSNYGANGCGEWSKHPLNFLASTPAASDLCEYCGNRLLSLGGNPHGHRLFLGQTIYFYRNCPESILEKGTVVYLPTCPTVPKGDDMSDHKVTVKYFEPVYRDDRYDQMCSQSKVILTLDMADSGKGKRLRRIASVDIKVASVKPVHKKSGSLISADNFLPANTMNNVSISVKEKKAQGERAIPYSRVKKRKLISETTLEPVQMELDLKESKTTVASSSGILSTSTSSNDSNLNPEYNRRFDKFGVHELVYMLFPPSERSPTTSVRSLDRYLKRGLLHAVWRYARPPDRGNCYTTRFSESVTLGQLYELLTVCPTHIDQMRNKELMPLCAPLLESPASPSFIPSEISHDHQSQSLGGELVQVVRGYLSKRGFDITANIQPSQCPPASVSVVPVAIVSQSRCRQTSPSCNAFQEVSESVEDALDVGPQGSENETSCRLSPLLPALPRGLSIPLSHDHFSIALDLAFDRLGGREGFENRKGVRGLDLIMADSTESTSLSSSRSDDATKRKKNSSKIDAMYGAMNPLFIEDCVVQPSQLGRSDSFLDIGSGIGQVVLQVAATVGCKSTGMEISQARHSAAEQLLDALEKVLDEAGVLCDSQHPTIRSLVDLKLMDFCSERGSHIVKEATVIFFNNFGPWFEPLISTFSDQLLLKRAGSQIIVLNPLIEVGRWSHLSSFQTGRKACTWSDLDNPVYHYSILSDTKMWTCGSCTLDNYVGIEECDGCGTKGKATRMGGNKSVR